MNSKVDTSPPLAGLPNRIVIVSDKNFAGVCTKYERAFNTIPGVDCVYVSARAPDAEARARQAISGMAHDKILILYYDPGDVQGHTHQFTERVNMPSDISWGLIRGSSFYRVENLQTITKPGITNVKKHGKYRKIVTNKNNKGPVKKALTVNHERMHAMNEFFDSKTPVILCGTEDLLGINRHSCYLGQPQEFLPYIPNKSPSTVVHITTPARGRDYKKGTGIIKNVFHLLSDNYPDLGLSIVGHPAIPHDECMNILARTGMSVLTMTSWDYGLGYVGLESLSRSCLCLGRLSKYSSFIRSPVVNTPTQAELIRQIKRYYRSPDLFEQARYKQYMWAFKHFNPEAVGRRLENILDTIINDGWRSETRQKLP